MLLDAQNNYKLASVSLDIMLGLDEKTLLNADSLLLGADSVKTIAEYEQLALQGRKDVQSLDARQAAAANGVKSAKADMYPSLALTGGYAAVYVPNLVTVYNAFNIGVGVKYSLSSLWKTKSKVAQQEALVKQAEASKGMLSDNIRLSINQSYENYLLSGKKVQVYNKAIEQSVENYRITNNKYNNSLATTTDLLDAEVAKYQSELNKAYAVTDLVVAYYKLLETTGTLSASF
jgi:outer membrane protein